MKTVNQIQKLIDVELTTLANQRGLAIKKESKTQRQIDFLKTVRLYLETNPRPEFIQSEIERLTARIEKINNECAEFKSKISIAKHKKLKDFTTLSKQLKTLNFIVC